MIIGIQGTSNFNDYTIFLRAMGTALSIMAETDNLVTVYSAGPSQINSFATEFTNIVERGMKARGKKIKLVKIPPSWLIDNIEKIDYVAYFSKPKEPLSKVVDVAEANNVDVGVYRY